MAQRHPRGGGRRRCLQVRLLAGQREFWRAGELTSGDMGLVIADGIKPFAVDQRGVIRRTIKAVVMRRCADLVTEARTRRRRWPTWRLRRRRQPPSGATSSLQEQAGAIAFSSVLSYPAWWPSCR